MKDTGFTAFTGYFYSYQREEIWEAGGVNRKYRKRVNGVNPVVPRQDIHHTRRLIERARNEFAEDVDPRHWRIFTNGTPQELDAVCDEMHRSLAAATEMELDEAQHAIYAEADDLERLFMEARREPDVPEEDR